MRNPTLLRWLSTLTFLGCATASYVYSPRDAATSMDGYPATVTAVPPEAPQGKVEVTSFGILGITAGNAPFDALHVRMSITNDGDATPWSLIASEQLIELPGASPFRPAYVNTDAAPGEVVEIGQRQRRVIDLYYALPAGVHDDADLAGFQLLWQVITPARLFASRTEFQRFENEPEVHAPVMLYAGWAPYWWYDPFWGRRGFGHHEPLIVRPGVIISRPPHRHYHPAPNHHG